MDEKKLGAALSRVRPLVSESERSPMGAMKKLMQENPDISNMAIGEANYDPPRELIEIAYRCMSDTVNRKNLYSSTRGLPETRAAVARYIKRSLGGDVDPDENILMTVGGMEALHIATKVLIEPGDKVLLSNPGWGVMVPLVTRQGGVVEFYDLARTDTWTIDADAIVAKMNPSVKVVVVNSPSNPSGAMITRQGWKKVMEAAKEMGIFVISDEVYHNFAFAHPYASALEWDPTLENLMVVDSFSKAFAVTGWRLGMAIAHPWLIGQMDVYKESLSACSPSIPQWAVGEYLDSADSFLASFHEVCKDNMTKMVARLCAIPGVNCMPPQGGFYVFPDFSGVEPDAMKLTERLLRGGVAVAVGTSFGSAGQGCARMGFAAYWDDIDKALTKVEKTLSA